jgi:hypothetical protein
MGCFLKVIYFRDQKMREILRIFSKSTLHDTLCVAILKSYPFDLCWCLPRAGAVKSLPHWCIHPTHCSINIVLALVPYYAEASGFH